MNLTKNKKNYEIILTIGLDNEEDFRAFRQIFRQWIDDNSGNSLSQTYQKSQCIAKEILFTLED